MDLIEMQIATWPDATLIAAHPYILALKHHAFLKQKFRNCSMQELSTKTCPHGWAQK